MPSSLVGAAIFVALLTPGFCYVLRSERSRRPGRRHSTFRETVTLVFASAWSLLFSVVVLAIVRAILPGSTPDVGRLVRNSHAYTRTHYQTLGWWALAGLAIACAFAFGIAALNVTQRLQWLFVSKDGVSHESTWWTLFEDKRAEDRYKRVTCYLTDGYVIQGTMYTYNASSEESDDRDLGVSGPFYVAEPDGTRRRVEEGAVVIPAGRISWLHVDYLTDSEHDELTTIPLADWRPRAPAVTTAPRMQRRSLWDWFLKEK